MLVGERKGGADPQDDTLRISSTISGPVLPTRLLDGITLRLGWCSASPGRVGAVWLMLLAAFRRQAWIGHCSRRPVGRGGQFHDLFLGGLFPGQEAADPTTTDHHDPIAHAQDLRQLRADHQDGDALLRELVDHPVDLDLGADVDPARRLVKDQHLGLGGQPFAQHDLLLRAAGQIDGQLILAGGFDRQAIDEALGQHAPLCSDRSIRPRVRRSRTDSVMFSRTFSCRHKTLLFAVLGQQADAIADGVLRRARSSTGLPVDDRLCRRRSGRRRRSARTSSVRPAPTSPAMPSTSPA